MGVVGRVCLVLTARNIHNIQTKMYVMSSINIILCNTTELQVNSGLINLCLN